VGRTSVFSTASNFAYRLAMLASDVGVSVHRILDSRAGAASRFIEFSRAYGMVQVPGTSVDAVEISRTGGSLRVATSPASAEPFTTERLLVSGGWQPDLTLWHVSGGSSRWHEAHHRLEPEGEVDCIMLAGSAAGYLTRRGCIQSGADAIDALLGRARRPVEDPAIDPIYETPDAAIPIAPPRTDASPTYLDNGSEFLQRPQPAPKSWINAFRRTGARRGLTALSETPQPLTINEVAAGVALGLIPSAAAGVVAQERVALVPLATAEPEAPREPPVAPEPAEVPPYLVGRFGPNAHVVKVVPAEQRRLDTGALIYASADKADPLSAIGVILRPHDGGATALVAAAAAQRGLAVTVRDHGRMVAASIELGGLSSG
jgi:sarcosine oxidase subunit alpha